MSESSREFEVNLNFEEWLTLLGGADLEARFHSISLEAMKSIKDKLIISGRAVREPIDNRVVAVNLIERSQLLEMLDKRIEILSSIRNRQSQDLRKVIRRDLETLCLLKAKLEAVEVKV